MRKNHINNYYNYLAKSAEDYAIDKTPLSEYNYNSSTGGTEPPEAISSKLSTDIFKNIDTLDSNTMDINTKCVATSKNNPHIVSGKSEI